MPLLLITPPVAEPVSLAETKVHLRLTMGDDDAYISTLITAARRAIEARYGLHMMRQTWALFADHWPDDGLFQLPYFPVQSVESVVSFSDDDVASTIDPAHYYLDAQSRPPRVALRRGRVFGSPGRKINGLKLLITSGFGMTAADVPQELKQAVMATVAAWYFNRGDEAGGKLPATVLELLAPYRNWRMS